MPVDQYDVGGLHFSDHVQRVPLDWSAPGRGEEIEVFYREISRRDAPADQPLLVFLQGGPGGQGPRAVQKNPCWLHAALQRYRVVLPDQRGTGRSSRVTAARMRGFASAEAGADFLEHMNAHAVVADLEHIRKTGYGGRPWTTLGQSYGGFLTLTYLSYAPQGVAASMVTGGLPALQADADQLYRYTYERVAEKWRAHRRRFPRDQALLDGVADCIAGHDVRLPNGDRLTVPRLQSLGLMLGMSDGSERLHWLLEQALAGGVDGPLHHHFLLQVMVATGMDANPLYAAIHEAIYANPDRPCDFAAERVRPAAFRADARPLQPTGEMIYPWMFDDIAYLRPWRDAVHALARRRLARPYYDAARLARNTVPVAALIYFADMYVDRRLSLQTAEHVGNLRYWITNEYEHDGLRQDPRVFQRLQEMLAQALGAV